MLSLHGKQTQVFSSHFVSSTKKETKYKIINFGYLKTKFGLLRLEAVQSRGPSIKTLRLAQDKNKNKKTYFQ